MPFITADELPEILARMILPNLRAAFDFSLVRVLQNFLFLLQCRDYDPRFQNFYPAAEDFLQKVMLHKAYP